MTSNEKPYWWACNTWAEGDEDSMESYPYQPCLQDRGHAPVLPIWFETEGQCVDFIENVLVKAGTEK